MKNKKLVLASGEIFYGMGYASDVETTFRMGAYR